METSDDVALLELCWRGDRDAYGQLVARYQSLVCSLAYSACGDLARSEDLAQETFITAWQRLGTLRERAKFKSWLCGIARHLIQNSLRREDHDVARTAAPLDSIPAAASPLPNPRDQAITREEENLLWRTLSDIPEVYREPLVLFYREQQSVEQVAASLELSEDAIKQRLSRGRALLREQVAAFVETTLRNTKPGKAFTLAVLVSLPAVVPPVAAAGVVAEAVKDSAAAKSAAALGLSGAVLGPVIGLMGAFIGARASIVNTKSPRERQFMVRQTWWSLGYVLVFLLAMGLMLTFGKKLLPAHPVWFAAILTALVAGYLVGMLALILRSNRRQRQIQIEDGTYVAPEVLQAEILKSSPERIRRGIYGGLAGSVAGSVAFAVVLAAQHRDWTAVGALALMAFGFFLIGAKAAWRRPLQSLHVGLLAPIAAALASLIVVDLRWSTWMAGSTLGPASQRWSLIGLNVFLLALLGLITLGILWNQRLHRTRPGAADGPPRE